MKTSIDYLKVTDRRKIPTVVRSYSPIYII